MSNVDGDAIGPDPDVSADGGDPGDDHPPKLRDALRRLRDNDATLVELKLDGTTIGCEGARALADALEGNETLRKLHLRNTGIGAEGGRALAEMLRGNGTLEELRLVGDEVGPGGCAALADALKANATLKKLDLAGNEIGDEGARAVASALKVNETLEKLDLGSNEIGDEGARALADARESNDTLKVLHLEFNEIADEGARCLAHALEGNETLTEMVLAGNMIGPKGASPLAASLEENEALERLALGMNEIGPEGADAERQVKELTATNVVLHRHREEVKARGISFYFVMGEGDGNCRRPSYIKGTVWEAAMTGDGRMLGSVHGALREYLGECDADALRINKDAFKKLFATVQGPDESLLLHLAAAKDCAEAFDLCKYLVEEIGADFDTVRDATGRTARDYAKGNARTNEWQESVGDFLGRYNIEGQARYKTDAFTIYFAVDIRQPEGDPHRNVGIKIMAIREQFKQYLQSRLTCDISLTKSGVDIDDCHLRDDDEHILPLLRYHEEVYHGKTCWYDAEYYGKVCRCFVVERSVGSTFF